MRLEPIEFAELITEKRIKVLRKIAEDEPDTIGDLRRSLDGVIYTDNQQSLTRMLDSLEEAGVIERKVVEDSNRHIKPKKPVLKAEKIESELDLRVKPDE
jgi:DNA-binding MarR family transcriptional regulator